MISITSKKEGFRRCGKAHSAKTTEYPDSAFTPEELGLLQGEPMLVVAVAEEKEAADKTADKKADKPGGK